MTKETKEIIEKLNRIELYLTEHRTEIDGQRHFNEWAAMQEAIQIVATTRRAIAYPHRDELRSLTPPSTVCSNCGAQ